MTLVSIPTDYDFHITDISHLNMRKANPDWKLEVKEPTDYYVIAYCTEGEAIYNVNGQEVHVQKGDFLFFTKGITRFARTSNENPWSFYSITFKLDLLNDDTTRLFNSIQWKTNSSRLHKLTNLFVELYHMWSGKRTGYTIKCKSILMELIYSLINEQSQSEYTPTHYRSIEKIINLLLENYKIHYSIDELAKCANISESHFRLLFKQITGMSPIQYQNYIRIHKAKDLLLDGNCNVSEASYLVGFQDIYYFSRLFKKIIGDPPSTYIQK